MKRFILTLLIFVTWFSQGYSDLDDVRKLFHIEGDQLVCHDGRVFTKLPFQNEFHEQLSFLLKDVDHTEAITNSFESYLAGTLDESGRKIFQQGILSVCQLFVAETPYSVLALEKSVKELGFDFNAWSEKHEDSLTQFFESLSPFYRKSNPIGFVDRPLNIVIITTTSSGGNLSVTNAVDAFLNKYKDKYNVTVLDYETFAEQYDPIKIATGKFTQDNIFRILQMENIANISSLIEGDDICFEVAKYIPNNTYYEMKKAVTELQPDIIISTRNYYADDFNFLSLGVPFRMLNCDHDICFFHHPLIGKVDSSLVKFWLPSSSPRFFKDYFEGKGRVDLYDLNDNWDLLMAKLGEASHTPSCDISSQFEVLGFPVRIEIRQETDAEIISQFRKKWSLENGQHGVIVELGANGVGIIEDIFDELKEQPSTDMNLKYFFVCGRNESLKDKLLLQKKNIDLSHTALKDCQVLGFISASEKNELLNISSLMLGKPGGSTQAENTVTKTPMLIMQCQEFCELGNKEKLIHDFLGYEYIPTLPLHGQVQAVINKVLSKPIKANDPDWKNNLIHLLEELRGQ